MPAKALAETTCGSLLRELQKIWDEIGESDSERDRMLVELERECLDVYRRKVDCASKNKADLHQALAEAEVEASNLVSALGERAQFSWTDKVKGTLKQQMSAIKPVLDDLRMKKEERVKESVNIQIHILQIQGEIAGSNYHRNSVATQLEERDLTLKKLGELKLNLGELQREKNVRVQQVNSYVKLIHELTSMMSMDFTKLLTEVHPSLTDSSDGQSKSISNETLAALVGLVRSLTQEKKERLQKIQDLGSTLMELWNLMNTPLDEQSHFYHVTIMISTSIEEVSGQGCLASDIIEKAEAEVKRLNILKASKMKELVLKKQDELEEIYSGVHMDLDSDEARKKLLNLIDSGTEELSELLSDMDGEIGKAKEQALSRKDILDKFEKFKFAYEEECWLDDFERDQNRYSAGRGAHKNLKRAEKARMLVSKISSLFESLNAKIKSWEEERGTLFMFGKRPLLEILEEHVALRQERQEAKRKYREQKKLQEQMATEQEVLYGSKRSMIGKKPLAPSASANSCGGTPTNRRVMTPGASKVTSFGKERKDSSRGSPVIPVNYVALPKDSSLLSP
ncbi:65-kDa microtubule-associated protein 5 [Aristolochia californica]|uniref:65-kDa microtubule-associated protein 5 n=1 Tax=Aristolochia californica TaxID=171875 RepID=UPI0035DA0D80